MDKYPDYLDENGNYKQVSLLQSVQTTWTNSAGISNVNKVWCDDCKHQFSLSEIPNIMEVGCKLYRDGECVDKNKFEQGGDSDG